MVVSAHTNEGGSKVCERTRGVPGWCAITNEYGRIAPSSPADAVPTNGVVVSECANERGSIAHVDTGAVHTMGRCPQGGCTPAATCERIVKGPDPVDTRPPLKRGFPADLAITEWERCIREEYEPSRKRRKPSVVDSGAALVRRKGDSFPCLIPGNSSQEDALRMGQELNPLERLLASALSPVEQACITYNCRSPSAAKQHRRKAIKLLHSLSVALRPAHDSLTRTLPEQVTARKLHIPLIAELAKRLDYTEVSLPDDLVRGMPIIGDIPCINALPSKVTPATMGLHDVRDAVRVTNAKVIKSLSKPNDLLLKQK